MQLPLVSVVVPTFNRAHLIGRTIASVLGQTHRRVEVIVVDDGSTDATREAIARDHGGDERVRYFRKENGGPASARNFGFRYARGAYVALLDSDDTWLPWKLSLQIRCMERDPRVGMTWTDMEMIDPRREGRRSRVPAPHVPRVPLVPGRAADVPPEPGAPGRRARAGRRRRGRAAAHRRESSRT